MSAPLTMDELQRIEGINVLVEVEAMQGGCKFIDECYTFVGSKTYSLAERLEGVAMELRDMADRLEKQARSL